MDKNLNSIDNYDVAKIKVKSVTDHHVPKMCAILLLVSPIPFTNKVPLLDFDLT